MCQMARAFGINLHTTSDYSSILFRVCHICNVKVFLCPICLNLRDRDEEYVNGYCIYE